MSVVAERYEAIVTSNEDEENRGRVRVACPALLPYEEGEPPVTLPQWVEPLLEWGWFYVPDVGETIEIEIASSSGEDESFQQMSIDNLRPRWRGKRFITDVELEDDADGDVPRPIHQDFTAENYGKRRGFSTPWGHIFLFDDTEGSPKIYLTWIQEQLEAGAAPDEAKISQILIDTDGSIKLSVLKNQFVHLKPENEIEVSLEEGKHTLVMKPDILELKLSEGASLKVEGKDGDSKLTHGDGAKHVAIVEHLQSFYEALKTKLDTFDTHIHPTGMGPSGPPNPTITADAWDSAINSTKVSIPDG